MLPRLGMPSAALPLLLSLAHDRWVMSQDQHGSPRLTGAVDASPTSTAAPRTSHLSRPVPAPPAVSWSQLVSTRGRCRSPRLPSALPST
jgi:hypothetical protein